MNKEQKLKIHFLRKDNMNESDYRLQLLLEAQDNASKVVEQLSNEVKRLQNQVNNSTKKMNDWVNSFWSALWWIKKVLWWIAIASIFSKWISVIQEATQKLEAYERQIERLRVLTENSTGATKLMTDELIRQAEAIDKVWVATKDWIVAAQAQFATFDMSTKAIKELIPAFTDYVIAEKWASASTEEYISMANGLAQALNWNYASLTRTWFILDEETKKIIENWNEMERVQAIVEVLNSTYEWFNQKLANTAEWMANLRVKEREAEFEAIAEKTRWLTVALDEAKTTFVNMLWSLLGVTTKTNDDVVLLKDNIKWLKDAMAELDAEWKSWKISAWEYLQELKKLKDETKQQEEELKNEEKWLINIEKAQKELEIATINVKKAYEDWRITLEQAEKAFAEIEKQQERLTSAQQLWAGATQSQMDILTRFRSIEKQVEEATKQLATAEKEYANLKADKSATKAELDAMKSKVDSLKTSLYQLRDAEREALNATPYAPLQNTVSKDLLQQYAEQWTQQHTISKPTNLWGWWWSGWSSKNAEEQARKEAEAYERARNREVAAAQKAHKEIKAEREKQANELIKLQHEAMEIAINRQMDRVKELNDTYQDKFDDISDKIEDTKKKIESLNNEIASLQSSMNNLKVDERKSIANEVIKARKEIQALEEQYTDLKRVADSVTREDLQWVWWVEKYDVDLIKKYKDYQDELASMYNWMSSEEQKALDKEIEYAEWYDNLNWIEKIKEDYRIRQEEIQNELNAKISSLNTEQELLRQQSIERDKIQQEWIKKLDAEVKKYEEMDKKKKDFEKTYMDILYQDQLTQLRYYDDLIRKAEELAIARERAARAWDWGWYRSTRASWWPVYQWQWYLVWETWPELFVPSTNWSIVKNSDLDNISSPINISIDMWWVVLNNWLDEEELLDRMESRLTRTLQLYKKWIYS